MPNCSKRIAAASGSGKARDQRENTIVSCVHKQRAAHSVNDSSGNGDDDDDGSNQSIGQAHAMRTNQRMWITSEKKKKKEQRITTNNNPNKHWPDYTLRMHHKQQAIVKHPNRARKREKYELNAHRT